MKELFLLNDDDVVPNGSIVRLYGVGRLDVMKTIEDRSSVYKKAMDFYEYVVVDNSAIKDNSIILVNITKGDTNRGVILCELEKDNIIEPLSARQLKNYFGPNATVFVDLNT